MGMEFAKETLPANVQPEVKTTSNLVRAASWIYFILAMLSALIGLIGAAVIGAGSQFFAELIRESGEQEAQQVADFLEAGGPLLAVLILLFAAGFVAVQLAISFWGGRVHGRFVAGSPEAAQSARNFGILITILGALGSLGILSGDVLGSAVQIAILVIGILIITNSGKLLNQPVAPSSTTIE